MTNVFLNWYLFQHFFRVNGNTVKQEWQCKEYLLSESSLLNHVLVRCFKSILVGCNVISLILMTAAFGCSSLIYFGAIICSLINTCISSSPASCPGCTSQSVQWGALAAFVAACYHTSLTQTNTTHSKLNARLHTCLCFFGVLFYITLYWHCSSPVVHSESLPVSVFCVICGCVFAHFLSAFEGFLHLFQIHNQYRSLIWNFNTMVFWSVR